MLSDLLDFLLQVSIWGTDNEVFSKRTQRVFQGIILLFLIAFAAVGVLLLYAGCDTGSGKLIFCGVFVLCLHRHHLQVCLQKEKEASGIIKEERAFALSSFACPQAIGYCCFCLSSVERSSKGSISLSAPPQFLPTPSAWRAAEIYKRSKS